MPPRLANGECRRSAVAYAPQLSLVTIKRGGWAVTGSELSSASLFRICTVEARKGRGDPGFRFDDVADRIRELKELRAERIEKCKLLAVSDLVAAAALRAKYLEQARTLRRNKDELLRKRLEDTSS